MNTIIIPPVTSHNLDAHSGFPFIPHMAGYLAGELKKYDDNLQIIDGFSEDPTNITIKGDFMFQGLTILDIASRIKQNTKNIFIYARTIIDYEVIIEIVRYLSKFKKYNIIIFENTQCVDALVLKPIYQDFLDAGANLVIFGEPENRVQIILNYLRKKEKHQKDLKIKAVAIQFDNFSYLNKESFFDKDIDKFSFPYWDIWNLNGYWKMNYSHPPSKNKDRFVTLITSRGCPFRCTFCVAPELNPTWRFRSPKNVVDEIEYFNKKLNINDFHISDLNPTIKEKRIIEICEEILKRKLKITWKIAQGTKIETIKNLETFDIMYKSGCRFLSFSPESGSERIMKNVINKPFKYNVALEAVKVMQKKGIRTQACFVVGMPGEKKFDRDKSVEYMIKLAKAGVDEVACYIITPLPGSKIFKKIFGYKSFSECSHTPTWRKDFKELYMFRVKFYIIFLFLKFIFYPKQFILMFYRLFTLNFETKMEMSFFKKIKLILMRYRLYKFR
jgi:radical SAM superfamily enzyme YgiQ (UPF0313 family)